MTRPHLYGVVGIDRQCRHYIKYKVFITVVAHNKASRQAKNTVIVVKPKELEGRLTNVARKK